MAANNLLGLAGVAGFALLGYHGTEFDVQRTSYASKEDCLKDWGTEESCSASPGGQGNYYGPRYYWDPRRNAPVVVTPDGQERVSANAHVGPAGSSVGHDVRIGVFSRGGFGGIGRGLGGRGG